MSASFFDDPYAWPMVMAAFLVVGVVGWGLVRIAKSRVGRMVRNGVHWMVFTDN